MSIESSKDRIKTVIVRQAFSRKQLLEFYKDKGFQIRFSESILPDIIVSGSPSGSFIILDEEAFHSKNLQERICTNTTRLLFSNSMIETGGTILNIMDALGSDKKETIQDSFLSDDTACSVLQSIPTCPQMKKEEALDILYAQNFTETITNISSATVAQLHERTEVDETILEQIGCFFSETIKEDL
ncbi:hypothetical protein WA158_005379 [Blastocystis sp. Blastoise]